MRNKLEENEKKQKISIALSPKILIEMKNIKNKSKYIEHLIYMHMVKNNILENNIML